MMRLASSKAWESESQSSRMVILPFCKDQITWSEIDNLSFLRLAHGTLLGLIDCREGKSAMVLAKKLLAWYQMDKLGVLLLVGDIGLINGDWKAAMKEYLNGAPNSPDRHLNARYQVALIAFREGGHVAACT